MVDSGGEEWEVEEESDKDEEQNEGGEPEGGISDDFNRAVCSAGGEAAVGLVYFLFVMVIVAHGMS